MAYYGFVTTLKNVRPHPNADRLQLGDCFGNTVCVNLDYYEGQVGVYFPTDGQLSVEFATQNNLLRLKDENGNNIGGYMDPDKRNVKAIKLRGEKSDGLFLPLSCLDYCYPDVWGGAAKVLKVGNRIDICNGHEICKKYIPKSNRRNSNAGGTSRTRKRKVAVAPLFSEHADTEQLAYNLSAFRPEDEIEITLKMHGTSQRTGYLLVLKGYKRTLKDRIFRKEGEPIYDWGYVTGTRRTVLDDYEGGYYGSNEFREAHSKLFEGRLWKGETVYYEVVGFTTNGSPIMGVCNNKKLNDKDFVKRYGEITTFSYGCDPDGCHGIELLKMFIPNDESEETRVVREPQSDIYVYRMTMTNEDGDVVEYTPDFMRYRCEQMGVKTVPVFWKGTIPKYEFLNGEHNITDEEFTSGDWIKGMAELYYDGPDPIGKTHIREGVVVRILNRPKFTAYKHKNFEFKVMSGIISENIEATDNISEDILSEM